MLLKEQQHTTASFGHWLKPLVRTGPGHPEDLLKLVVGKGWSMCLELGLSLRIKHKTLVFETHGLHPTQKWKNGLWTEKPVQQCLQRGEKEKPEPES